MYLGETIDATKSYFDQIYSIELSKYLYQRSRKMFVKEKLPNHKLNIENDIIRIYPKGL